MRCGALQQNRVTHSCWRCRPGERGLGRDGRAASNPVHRRRFPTAAGACAWLTRLPASALVLWAATPAQRSSMDCARRPPGRVAGRGGAIWRVRRRRNRCRGCGSSARTGSWTDRETHRPDPTHAAPATCTSVIAWISPAGIQPGGRHPGLPAGRQPHLQRRGMGASIPSSGPMVDACRGGPASRPECGGGGRAGNARLGRRYWTSWGSGHGDGSFFRRPETGP